VTRASPRTEWEPQETDNLVSDLRCLWYILLTGFRTQGQVLESRSSCALAAWLWANPPVSEPWLSSLMNWSKTIFSLCLSVWTQWQCTHRTFSEQFHTSIRCYKDRAGEETWFSSIKQLDWNKEPVNKKHRVCASHSWLSQEKNLEQLLKFTVTWRLCES
jgi:hypothetical protein